MNLSSIKFYGRSGNSASNGAFSRAYTRSSSSSSSGVMDGPCLLVDWGMLGLRVATFGMFGWFSYAVGRAEAYVGKNHQGNHKGNHREGTFKEDG